MAPLIVAIVACGTLAFGAVYPWAYLPLYAAAALIGMAGLVRGGVRRSMRPLALALLLVWAAGAAQLLPLPRATLESISPATAALLQNYSFSYAEAERAPLSVDPAATRRALLAFAALALYTLGLPSLLSSQSLRSLPRLLAVFAIPLALFSIYARETQNGLLYWIWKPLEGMGHNQFGPFINRNHYGGWMLMTLCLLIGWLIGEIERSRSGRRAGRSRLVAWLSSAEANRAALMAVAVLVGALSLFWTLSRSSILCFGLAALTFAWLAMTRGRLGTTRRMAAAAGLGGILVAGVAWRGPVRLVEWFQDNNLSSRLDAWRDGWDVIRAFPWTGTGLNTYGVSMLFYQSRNPDVFMSRAHNDYVQFLAEGGALMAVPAILAAGALALAIRRNLRAAHLEARGYWIRTAGAVGLLAITAQESLEFSLQIPVNAFLFCTLAALALTPPPAGSDQPPRPRDTIPGKKASDVTLPSL